MKALQWLLLLCFRQAIWASAGDSAHVYLQRGKPGEIPNPHVTGDAPAQRQFSSAYWYRGDTLLVSNWEGTITQTSARYNITETLALLVYNVSDADVGRYISRVVRNEQVVPDCTVDVTVFVSPSPPAPWIEECGMPKDNEHYCTIQLPPGQTEHHLTCHVTGARPAVDLHLWRIRADGSPKGVEQVFRRVQREDLPQDGAIGTDRALFSTSLFFNGTFHGNTSWVCVATGLAMGDHNGSAIQVYISKQTDDVHVPSTDKVITDVEKEGNGRLVMEGVSIALACSFAVLLVVFVWKKTGCKMEHITQMEQRLPFLPKGPTTDDSLASQLKTYYANEMGTIPIHPSDFAVSMRTGDIFVLPELSRVTNNSSSSERVLMKLQGVTTEVYLDVPDKEPLHSIDDLIQILSNDRHAVVVANPGCGKNSIIVKIASDFSTGDLKSPFEYVFILRRKEVYHSTGVLASMHRLLPSETRVSVQRLRSVIKKHQRKVLIIVDCAYLLEALSSDDAIMPVGDDDISFVDLLSVRGLVSCSLLVTASPHQLRQLQSFYSNYTVVEASGFSVARTVEYIHNFFSDDDIKADALIAAVQSDTMASLAQSPITLQVLCCIWKTRYGLPERLTELYDKVLDAKVNNVERKYGIPRPRMDSLKVDIGRVACGGLTDPRAERRVFSPDEFPDATLAIGLSVGILCKETRTSEGRSITAVKFLHLFQAYFAAQYLSTQTANVSPGASETIPRNEHLKRFHREMSDETSHDR